MGREFDLTSALNVVGLRRHRRLPPHVVLLRESRSAPCGAASVLRSRRHNPRRDSCSTTAAFTYTSGTSHLGYQALPCGGSFSQRSLAYRYRNWFNGWRSVFHSLRSCRFCYIGAFTLSAMPTIFVIQGDFCRLLTQLWDPDLCNLGDTDC